VSSLWASLCEEDVITLQELLWEADEWVGTPIRQSGSIKQQQCNCLGMCGGIARELGLQQAWDAFQPYEGSGIPPEHHFLIKGLRQHLKRVKSTVKPAAGHLLLIHQGGTRPDATHVALCVGPNKMINPAGKHVHYAALKNVRIIEKYEIPGVKYE
jgi:cell wall-associated NlpC family hydrolase